MLALVAERPDQFCMAIGIDCGAADLRVAVEELDRSSPGFGSILAAILTSSPVSASSATATIVSVWLVVKTR